MERTGVTTDGSNKSSVTLDMWDRCWFCSGAVDDEKDFIKKQFHKVKGREVVNSTAYNIRYEKREITIPRCPKCAQTHSDRMLGYGKIGAIIGVPVGIVVSILNHHLFLGYVFTALFFSFIGFVVAGLTGFSTDIKGCKAELHHAQFPLYKEILASGWKNGAAPSK